MPADQNRASSSALFRDVETNLSALRETAAALRNKRSSWFGKSDSNQPDFGTSLVDALENLFAELRQAIQAQNGRLAELERELGELNTLTDGFRELRSRVGNTETELAQAKDKSERLLAEHGEQAAKVAGELREQVAKVAAESREQTAKIAGESREQTAKIAGELREQAVKVETELREQIALLSQGQRDLGKVQADVANELRERIQQTLDEQRVCIRQISLKTSEDAVLADRARRALELRLDAIQGRLPETPPK